MVVSHFDRDHVNGMTRLRNAGLSPDHIILPYLNPYERVIQILENVASATDDSDDQSSTEDEQDIQLSAWLVADPESYASEMWPETVIHTISPEGQEEPASDWMDLEPIGFEWDDPELDDAFKLGIKFNPQVGLDLVPQDETKKPNNQPLWQYRWREHRQLDADEKDVPSNLAQALAQDLEITVEEVASPSDLWSAIAAKDAWKTVGDIYRQELPTSDLNPYSLMLWSGPGPGARQIHASRGATLRNLDNQTDRALKVWGRTGGWLGTGDAVLKSGPEVDRLIYWLGALNSKIDVLNAPHHGSRNNSDNNLYSRVPEAAGVVLAPADGKNNWHHPHSEVVIAAITEGHAVMRVGDRPDQRFMWSVTVR